MRVTQSMLAGNMLRNIGQSYGRLGELQNQLYSNRKISKPSQDPVVAMKGIAYRESLAEIKQFQKNVSHAQSWLDNTDTSLAHADNAMKRIRDLVVQANNGPVSAGDQAKIEKEVAELREDLIDIANTQFGGRYIFNGTNTETPPIDESRPAGGDPPPYMTGQQPYEVEVSKGVKIDISTKAEDLFNEDLFNMLDDLKAALSDTENSDMDGMLDKIDNYLGDLTAERAEVGARTNRVDLVKDRMDSQHLFATEVLSKNEDADIEKVITELKMQETVHRAALSVGARIMQPSLMDFLR
ncbi:flagellar hook-associated protein FlgL [Bacillaceae bacterium SIJ1]|uniref:flagellar hook-associated protein FlgL n=1 Tax=Litoribacterium kuwaitense TaxID=1398745 RepID=UPI0013EAEF15|nr:flagellar hook-associated protein FlgL [Litoribacterium kuwaitense]NGP44939.1 flagellar hook-associated protein FlgL [Litoribacterium kuwaitense]